MGSRSNPLGWPTWLWRCLVAYALVMAAYTVVGSLSGFARAGGWLRDGGPPSLTLARPAGTPTGWSRVIAIEPGGAAAEAGLMQGDLVRSDRMLGLGMLGRAGWPHPLTVERDDARFRTEIISPPPEAPPPPDVARAFIRQAAGGLATLALAALVMLRARHNRAAVMLGMLLLAYAIDNLRGGSWAPNPVVAQFWGIVGITLTANIAYFKTLFALEISGGAAHPRQARWVHVAALTFAALFLAERIALQLQAPVLASQLELVVLDNALIFGIIAWNYRRNDAAARNRIKIVAVALALYLLSILIRLFGSETFIGPPMQDDLGVSVLQYSGLALLTYAVLRQKLFDLNFALNRTLVYATVSFVLLAAFGIAKWVIEHLVPQSWHAGSEYYSVGIALGLFLVLHRVHNWAERNVERVFFSPWHRNEEALRRFVTAAGHFDQTGVLCRAFAEELQRFANGAEAALYLRGRTGAYARQCDALDEAQPEYEADDLVLALMRAERQPVRIAETPSGLPGVLALPMLDHGKLTGFALLDGKPDGSDYRPDEVEILGWAAHQVGLDLQAMHAGELEAEVAALHATVAALSAQLAAAGTRRRTRTPTGSAA